MKIKNKKLLYILSFIFLVFFNKQFFYFLVCLELYGIGNDFLLVLFLLVFSSRFGYELENVQNFMDIGFWCVEQENENENF